MKKKNNKLSENGCLPCDIPPFSRNNYFTGKLLTERDFTAEQQYSADKLRLHHVALHGWGVVCGLKVKPHPYCPGLRIIVEPGLAIDGCGREVRVPEEMELLLPSVEPAPVVIEDPCPPDPAMDEAEKEANQTYQEQQTYEQPTIPLYVCLRYVERPTEPMPAPFNECGCGTGGNQPNRICESYDLEILTNEPKCFERVRMEKEEYASYDSHQIYETLFDRQAEPRDLDCIPLAIISNFAPGQEVKGHSIHNHGCRKLLPSTTVLDQLIRCILERIPTRIPTKIIEIGWTHRGEYHWHDFMRLFIGEHEHTPGFVVTFDRPIRTESITPRTFQAIAIRYLEKTDGAGAPEIVPAEVKWNSERTKIHLRIDRQYARNRLDRTRFDLYLLVRCNLIVDDRGFAVDGELIAKLDSDGEYVASFPTGDGIAGGLFESWIRVVHGEIREGGSHVYHT